MFIYILSVGIYEENDKKTWCKKKFKKTKRRYKKNLGKTKRRYRSKKGGGGDVAPSLHKHYVLKDNEIILYILLELFDDCKFIKDRTMAGDTMRLNIDCGLNISPLFYNLDFQKKILKGQTLEAVLHLFSIKTPIL